MTEWIVQVWKSRGGVPPNYERYDVTTVDEAAEMAADAIRRGVAVVQVDRM